MKSKVKFTALICCIIGIVTISTIRCNDDGDVIVPDQVPTLTTTPVFNISQNTATSGGNISDNYDSPVTARGVCWGTNPDLDISGNKTVDGVGIGPFESQITGLSPGQVYYVKAYATNAAGNGYGSTLQFTTLGNQGQVPALTTASVTNITASSALSGGNISSDNGSAVSARGVCWSTSSTPTINDSKTIDGTGIGTFQSNITGLSANQTYYVRAYATNAIGTGYGSSLQFVTENGGGGSTVTDPDGNTYNTVTIGTQVWLKENLKTTKYNDGSLIPHEPNGQGWQQMTTPAYTWYDDNYEEIGSEYGALYNWYVVDPASNGNKNVCPQGWHVPSNEEFNALVEYLGGHLVAGGKLKETGTEHWKDVNVGATNESGFTAFGAGHIITNYSWNLKDYGKFWSTTPSSIQDWAIEMSLDHAVASVGSGNSQPMWAGKSIRCVKD